MNPVPRFDPDDPYPDSDGAPMAENTLQFDWIVKIKENLEILFADRPDVFVAGDLFWYPVPDRRLAGPLAPDAMVVFGRPKGPRGSYKQWEEDGIAPQVVFEVQSPSNGPKELKEKLEFYDTYGATEYYLYDPELNRLEVWLRQDGRLAAVAYVNGWTSPRLGIRFALRAKTLEIFDPDGRPFLSPVELAGRARQAEAQARQAEARAAQERARAEQECARAEQADVRAGQERARAEQERLRAEQEHARAEQECARAEQLAERLRALGIDPDAAG
jgi:Uma2 family endonuclease